MTFEDVTKVLDELGEKLNGRGIVLQLCKEDATEYERGRIKGQIEMLSSINRALAKGEGNKELEELENMDGE